MSHVNLLFSWFSIQSATKGTLAEENSSDEKSVVSGEDSAEVNVDNKKPKLTMDPNIPNVIYIGHLPRDCEERALTEFLKQFGRLVQLRVCRSHKTGGSKGYAFAKFAEPEVATIAADTVNGHMLFQKRLVSHVLAPEQNHPKLFSSNAPRSFQKKAQQTGPKSLEKMKEATKRLKQSQKKKRRELESKGIDFDPGFSADNAPNDNASSEDGKKKRTKSMDEAETEESSPPKKCKKEKGEPQSEKKAKKSKDKKRRVSA